MGREEARRTVRRDTKIIGAFDYQGVIDHAQERLHSY